MLCEVIFDFISLSYQYIKACIKYLNSLLRDLELNKHNKISQYGAHGAQESRIIDSKVGIGRNGNGGAKFLHYSCNFGFYGVIQFLKNYFLRNTKTSICSACTIYKNNYKIFL